MSAELRMYAWTVVTTEQQGMKVEIQLLTGCRVASSKDEARGYAFSQGEAAIQDGRLTGEIKMVGATVVPCLPVEKLERAAELQPKGVQL